MRILIALLLAAFLVPAFAQSGARPRPPGSLPLEDVPPPPPMVVDTTDSALETQLRDAQMTERTEGDQRVQEYRVKGKLFMMRVTPKHGRPYIMIDHKGDGQFARQDNLDSGVRVPQWVLVEF